MLSRRTCLPALWLTTCMAIAAGTSLMACGGSSSGPGACVSNRDYFDQEVWAPVLSRYCVRCHAPGGLAAEKNAKLILLPPSYPNFMDLNLANVSLVAKLSFTSESVLLLKPLGKMGHGGARVLPEGSQEYEALKTLVGKLNGGAGCQATSPLTALNEAQLLDPGATLRKASLQLTGKLPDPNTTQALQLSALGASQSSLEQAILKLTDDAAFYQRLKTLFNDTLLTDQYVTQRNAVGLLSTGDFPNIDTWFRNLSSDDMTKVNDAVAREPLALIEHVVRNNRPFTEILTAPYIMVNPWSAQLYGAAATFANINDPNEFQESQLTIPVKGQPFAIPHAGLLSSPMFLSRYPTTPTNRNRHRASIVLRMFLGTDILALADRPIDPAAGSQYENPTRDSPACNVCHRILDPIAGSFQKWDDNQQTHFLPARNWYNDMVAPGYDNEIMTTADFDHAQAWVAERIIKDSRFPTAIVNMVYRGLFGQAPLDYPSDSTSSSFGARHAAWRLQDEILGNISSAFVTSGYNFKVLVAKLLASPLYRAIGMHNQDSNAPIVDAQLVGARYFVPNDSSIEAATVFGLSELGTYRLLTPELLDWKITALAGISWSDSNKRPFLLNQYRLLYGGIDSASVISRLTQPNGVMANLAMRMANEVACAAVPRDFFLPQARRVLFPKSNIADIPETSDGASVPAHQTAIRANIAYLHQRLLGEDSDTEVQHTVDLFNAVWREGFDGVAADTIDSNLPGACRFQNDPDTGEALPADQRIVQDNNYMIRAWMAVITYLLADYRFLHD